MKIQSTEAEQVMAINKELLKEFIQNIDELLEQAGLQGKVKEFVKKSVIGEAIKSIEEDILQSRNPRFYLVGRSGHGKSSLINTLCGKVVATVGHTKPESVGSDVYQIPFPDLYACWDVVDSRGIFESTGAGGTEKIDVVEYLKKDIVKHRPDIILHVISSKETRAMAEDFKALDAINLHLKETLGYLPPAIMVLTHCDNEKPSNEWPIQSAMKFGSISQRLEYVAKDILVSESVPLNKVFPYKGISIQNWRAYCAIVPVVCAQDEERLWNIDTLQELIGEKLPKSALLGFAQASRQQKLLENLSRGITKRFAGAAAAVGSSPIPVSDIAILVPLQSLLIAIIAGLSCRKVDSDTVKEYLAAVGIDLAGGVGLRLIAQQLIKFIPIVGSVLSGAIAAAGTYAIGVSAEKYFFRGIVEKPDIDAAKESI